MNYKKIMMAILIAIIVLSLVLIGFLIFHFGMGNSKDNPELTWEEYCALSPEQQIEFQNDFKNSEDFENWMQNAQQSEVNVPWENGGKKPEDYTWEEFEALTGEQQIIFQNSFKDFKDFENWMQNAQSNKGKLPWENGGKKPENYTMEEFEALTEEQQMAFQNSFDNSEEFEEWMQNSEANGTKLPWENGEKEPSEYTWEEFEALTGEQQMAFQNSFDSNEDFENWMQSVNGENTDTSFENEELYSVTWEEFQAMSMNEQMEFQKSFGDIEEFDKWLQANEPK